MEEWAAFCAPAHRGGSFVIDQSGSMDEKMFHGRSKAEFVADVLNKTLVQIITRLRRNEGVRNYFEIGVIGYGGSTVGPGFGGALASQVMHPLPDVDANPLRVEDGKKKVDDGAGGIVEQSVKFPVWFEPKNDGGTPMCDALRLAAEVLAGWCDAHAASYPPTLIHVTDGQSTDGDPSAIADAIRQISTRDGECLLFNLHVDTGEGQGFAFPSSETGLPDAFSKMLFRRSSLFPPHLIAVARSLGYSQAGSESRFFAYKQGVEGIADFFNIGTQASNLR
ncbi:MAG: VWA domain-containing protein [Acetobacteraceae bacterium]|nr:VWA domain-containing protein [Acetobacteraceae bacterium]